MEKITIKSLLETAKQLDIPEDAEILFQYRENLFSDKGKDYTYSPGIIHAFVSKDGTKQLCLVGITAPEIC